MPVTAVPAFPDTVFSRGFATRTTGIRFLTELSPVMGKEALTVFEKISTAFAWSPLANARGSETIACVRRPSNISPAWKLPLHLI